MPLRLSGIGHTYGAGLAWAARALEGVELEVSSGELVLVVGATGSGKSTLLRIAAGLLPPSHGAAEIDGRPLTSASARGAVGLCFQNAESQLFAETLAEDAAFGPRNLGATPAAARAAAHDALAAVGLDPDAYGPRSPFTLSGGEARRAALAGVLAMRPRYLLLDEPTAGLDARGRRLVREAVRHARKGAGVALVTHDPGEFLGEADRVLVLDAGCTRFWGDAAQLIADPSPLAEAGVEVPPVLQVQAAAHARGLDAGKPTMDVAGAARALARAGGWCA